MPARYANNSNMITVTVSDPRIRTACIYIPSITGSLSVIGSGSILYSIWANRSAKLKDPQHRILGMMSIFDMLFSMNAMVKFLTYPSGLGVRTFGNDATCSLQGFFIQFGFAAASYNMVLSIYYYLIINRGMKKEEFAKVWEKVLNGIVIICHLSFAITSVSIGLINPTDAYCHIAPGPYGCDEDPNVPCPFEKTYKYFGFAFSLGWILLAIVVIIVTNLLICLFVRRQEKVMEKYRTRSVAAEQLSDMEKKTSYARSVFVQSMFYVGAFLLSWLSQLFNVVNLTTGVYKPWMAVLVATFNPLQGFFNAFIYARPRYLRLKNKNKHMGFKQLVKLVFIPSNDDSGPDPSASAGKSRKGKGLSWRGLSSTAINGSSIDVNDSTGPSVGKSRKDSNMFKSFLSSLSKKEAAEPYPAVSETEVAKEKTIKAWSDSKLSQDIDEERGKVGEGETTNGDDSPAMDEEEKIEEGE